MMNYSILRTLIVSLLMGLYMTTPCFAHKVRIFAWEEDGRILTESKFSGGRPAKQVAITVIDSDSGEQLLSGSTDDAGNFAFQLPSSTAQSLEIIVDGGDGHKNSWVHEISPRQPPQSQVVAANIAEDPPNSPPSLPTDTPGQGSLTREEAEKIFTSVLEAKLAPIRKTLAENAEKGTTLQDILGGIGYILGIAGIASYIQSRKNNRE